MTKADIVRRIAQATGLTKTDTAAVVDGFIESVIEALQQGEHIEIRGFGTFKAVSPRSQNGTQSANGFGSENRQKAGAGIQTIEGTEGEGRG